MIDHVSLPVRDLARARSVYDAMLAPLAMTRLIERPTTIGYGKTYPSLWLNARPDAVRPGPGSGLHICLRAPSAQAVEAFHAAALAGGGACDGPPGLRAQYLPNYFAAFIRDLDGNRLEAVVFLPGAEQP